MYEICVWYFIDEFVFFFKQKTAYEMRISDWSSDVCSSDLGQCNAPARGRSRARQLDEYRPHLRGAALLAAAEDQPEERRSAWPGVELQARCRSRDRRHADRRRREIGRASCRERVCQYV